MFKLDSEAALVKSFRPKDQKVVEAPAGLAFPAFVTDYLAWTHPAGGRVYLCFAVKGGLPTGIAFQTNGGSAATVPSMCQWCLCSSVGTVAMLTATVNGNKRAGVWLCGDLGCQRRLEDDANRAGRSVRPDMERLVERMGHFASDGLGIDLFGSR